MDKSLAIFVCEDHPIVLRGLKDTLEQADMRVVGEASTRGEAVARAFEQNPDVVLVDLTMGGDDGPSIVRLLMDKNPDARIVVFSMRNNIHTINAAYREGAKAYITKDSDPAYLIDAIRQVAGGDVYVMPKMAMEIFKTHTLGARNGEARWPDPREVLTKTEFRIFSLLVEGQDADSIARTLELSSKSVANRMASIRGKLNCASSQFYHVAKEYGLA